MRDTQNLSDSQINTWGIYVMFRYPKNDIGLVTRSFLYRRAHYSNYLNKHSSIGYPTDTRISRSRFTVEKFQTSHLLTDPNQTGPDQTYI